MKYSARVGVMIAVVVIVTGCISKTRYNSKSIYEAERHNVLKDIYRPIGDSIIVFDCNYETKYIDTFSIVESWVKKCFKTKDGHRWKIDPAYKSNHCYRFRLVATNKLNSGVSYLYTSNISESYQYIGKTTNNQGGWSYTIDIAVNQLHEFTDTIRIYFSAEQQPKVTCDSLYLVKY